MNSLELAKKIKILLEDKIAEEIVVFDISKVSTLADYFIMATGNADTHVRAISEYMVVELKKLSIEPYAHEGLSSGEWVCVDYNDILVHIMRQKEREFYNLEAIWGGCKKI